MSGHELDVALQEFKRRQKRARISFGILVSVALAVTLSILAYSSYQTKRAQISAGQQMRNALDATQKLNTIASDILKKVRAIDEQSAKLTNGESPTVYLWRAGLHPKNIKAVAAEQQDAKLIEFLKDRKSLLSESGPAIANSNELQDYVCDHIWYVVGESKHPEEAQAYLAAQVLKDHRFELAEAGGEGPKGWVPILIGFFLTREEAEKLKKEIGLTEFNINEWDFGQYRPRCTKNRPLRN